VSSEPNFDCLPTVIVAAVLIIYNFVTWHSDRITIASLDAAASACAANEGIRHIEAARLHSFDVRCNNDALFGVEFQYGED